jgi:threonine synthase
MQHACVECGARHETGFQPFCAACGGMVDVEYPLAQVRLVESADPYIRFAPLLPLRAPASHLPAAVFTPLVHAVRLGRAYGLDALYLKDETVLPTCTTKDRMAALALAYLHERGVRAFTASSNAA